MRAVKRKITDMTVDELKEVIHEASPRIWRSGGRPSRSWRTAGCPVQIRQADLDRAAGKKGAFVAWDDLRNA